MENSTLSRCTECDQPNRRRQKTCSERCADRAKYRARPRAACSLCGGPTGYWKHRAPASPTCNQCRVDSGYRARKARRAVERGVARRRNAAKRLGQALPQLDRIFIQGACASCGEVFVAQGVRTAFCSPECSRTGRPKPPRPPRSVSRFANMPKPHGGRIPGAVRRVVYERDGWRCQLCGDPVAKRLHYLDPLAATLDHIECQSWALIPDDSPRNLRLAHRICNSLRGDDPDLDRTDIRERKRSWLAQRSEGG